MYNQSGQLNCKLIPYNPNALIFLFNKNNKLFKRCLFSISMPNLPLSRSRFGLSLTFYSLLGPIGYTRAVFLDIHLALEYIQTCILIQIDLFFHFSVDEFLILLQIHDILCILLPFPLSIAVYFFPFRIFQTVDIVSYIYIDAKFFKMFPFLSL